MKIKVIHGPNLNLLGIREPEIYGSFTMDDINNLLLERAKKLGIELDFFQFNSEGDIVTEIQNYNGYDGLLLNPAAYTHTSVAIRDAIAAVEIATVEVHLSNIHQREDFRSKSFIAPVSIGQISGFGEQSYLLGLNALHSYLQKKEKNEKTNI